MGLNRILVLFFAQIYLCGTAYIYMFFFFGILYKLGSEETITIANSLFDQIDFRI